jgi:glutamate transport system permease protein
MSQASVLYDAPGPRARARNRILTGAFALLFLLVAYLVYGRFDSKGQWEAAKWEPFLRPEAWTGYLLPGLLGTLKAAVFGAVLAMVFGVVFGIARLSEHAWIRIPAGAVVEFFRSIPLLLLIFFAFFAWQPLTGGTPSALWAVIFGLTMYNGSVLAEVIRAGVRSVPRGQREAAYALGLRKGQVMSLVLLPQAITAMMPVIVSQLVVLVKDSALGFIIGFEELLSIGTNTLPANYQNVIPAVIVVAVIYILLNMALSRFAHWVERRNARRGRSAAAPIAAEPGGVETAAAPGVDPGTGGPRPLV